jgi:hypothetical protein
MVITIFNAYFLEVEQVQKRTFLLLKWGINEDQEGCRLGLKANQHVWGYLGKGMTKSRCQFEKLAE